MTSDVETARKILQDQSVRSMIEGEHKFEYYQSYQSSKMRPNKKLEQRART
jgi:hypothetical protein